MLTARSYFVVLLASTFLFSCVSQSRVSGTKSELKTADSTLISQQQKLEQLDRLRRLKVDENEMDDTSSSRIHRYIAATKDEIQKMHAESTIRIGEAVVNRKDWLSLLSTLSLLRSSQKKIENKILFLSDLISQNTVVRIDQDVLFEPGSYQVSSTMAAAIAKLFEPAATAIDAFTKKYPDFPLSLVITAKGYADATTISEGSALYRSLRDRMKLSGNEPDNKALNKELSFARAQEVIELFKKFAAARASNRSYIQNVLYLYEGKGETLPDPKVKDYTAGDPRRRVVYLFWSVFPE